MKIVPSTLDVSKSHHLMISAVLPRPIALVSTVGADGVFNLAPYSCFSVVSMKPTLVCLGISTKRDGRKKDTLTNIECAREVVVNVVDNALAEAMNQSSADYPIEIDEFKEVGLTPFRGDLVKAPRVAESPVSMECKVVEILRFGDAPHKCHVILGEVILVHIRDDLWTGEEIALPKWQPIGRLGGKLCCHIQDTFEMERPAR